MKKHYTSKSEDYIPFSFRLLKSKISIILLIILLTSIDVFSQIKGSTSAIIRLKINGTETKHGAEAPQTWGGTCGHDGGESKISSINKTIPTGVSSMTLWGELIWSNDGDGDPNARGFRMEYRFYHESQSESPPAFTNNFANMNKTDNYCDTGNRRFVQPEGNAATLNFTSSGKYYLDVRYFMHNAQTGGSGSSSNYHGGFINGYTAQFNYEPEDIYLTSGGIDYLMNTTDGVNYRLTNFSIAGGNAYFKNLTSGTTTKYWSKNPQCWNSAGVDCTADASVGSVPAVKLSSVAGTYDIKFNKDTRVYSFLSIAGTTQTLRTAKVNMVINNLVSSGDYWYNLTGFQPTQTCHKNGGERGDFNREDNNYSEVIPEGGSIKIGGEVLTNNDPVPVYMHYIVRFEGGATVASGTRTLEKWGDLPAAGCDNGTGQKGTQYGINASSLGAITLNTPGNYEVEVWYSAMGAVASQTNGLSIANNRRITGNHATLTSWGDGVQMGHGGGNWYHLYNFVMPGVDYKFRGGSFNWWGKATNSFPSGTAIENSNNLTATAGTYSITFNSSTGAYNFTSHGSTIYLNNYNGTSGLNYKTRIKVVEIIDENDSDDGDGNYGFTDEVTDPGCINCSGLYESYMGLLLNDANGTVVANQVYNLDGARGSDNTSNVRLGNQFPGVTFKIGTEVKAWARGSHKMCGCSSWFYVYDVDDTNPVETDFPLPASGSKFTSFTNGKFTLMNTSDNLGSFHTPIPLNPEDTSGMGTGRFSGSVSDNSDDSSLSRRKYEILLRDKNIWSYNNVFGSTYSMYGTTSNSTDIHFTNVSGKDQYGTTSDYASGARLIYDYDFPTNGWLKVRNNDAWTENYGGITFPEGTTVAGGANINVNAGAYTILFNKDTRELIFSKTNLYRWKDFQNTPGITTAVNQPVYEVACPSCGGEYKVAVALLCWASNNRNCNDNSSLYYHRDINQNKTYNGISLNPHHPDALDKPTNGAVNNTLPGTNLFYVQSISITNSGRENRWNGTAWTATNNTTNPEKYDDVFVDSNLTIDSSKSFTCVNLNVATGVTLTISADAYVEVLQQATTSGTGKIVVATKGNFVQRCNNLTGVAYIEHDKQTRNIAKNDYVYWSSPVQENIKSQLETAGMSRMYYWQHGASGGWQGLSNTGSVAGGGIGAGRGFIAWNPGNEIAFTAPIKGTTNSGIAEVTLTKQDDDVNNVNNYALLGNPYPCALDGQDFLLTNSDLLQGTLWYWTSNTRLKEEDYVGSDSNRSNYNPADYSTWNLTAGAGTAASTVAEDGIGNTSAPTSNIASGQGFFVRILADGDAEFNNDMRKTTSNLTTLFRAQQVSDEGKSRIWLNINNGKGDFRQMVLGYLDGATTGYDNLYDADINSTSKVIIYTKVGSKKLTIQGRPKELLEVNESIPVGIRVAIQDEFELSLDSYDGQFENKEIYLKDKKLAIDHDLSNSPYTFTTESGTYDDRFELFFKDKSKPSVVEPTDTDAPLKVVVSENVIIVSKATQKIAKVELLNILGKYVSEKEYKDSSPSVSITDVIKANQVLVVKVTYADGSKETKKIIY